MATGGEPLLYPVQLTAFIERLRTLYHAKIFLYTADIEVVARMKTCSLDLDGFTLTLHEESDREEFFKLGYDEYTTPLSVRLNTFVDVPKMSGSWDIKRVEWIKDCPLPAGEDFIYCKGWLF